MAAQMLEEMVVGRSGNEVLAAVVERMEAEGKLADSAHQRLTFG